MFYFIFVTLLKTEGLSMNDNYSIDFELIGLIMFSSLPICIVLLKKTNM